MVREWEKESIRNKIDAFVKEKNRLPTSRELCKRNGLPDRATVERVMGMT